MKKYSKNHEKMGFLNIRQIKKKKFDGCIIKKSLSTPRILLGNYRNFQNANLPIAILRQIIFFDLGELLVFFPLWKVLLTKS